MNAALLSSKNMCWCTPQDFFDRLNAEFGFVLDPAATQHIFTITFTGKRKSASCAGGYGSRTTTGTPPIPRPSRQW